MPVHDNKSSFNISLILIFTFLFLFIILVGFIIGFYGGKININTKSKAEDISGQITETPIHHGNFLGIFIDNIETFGDDAALDADQAQSLVKTFNQENLQTTDMDPYTHYSTEYVMERNYREWKNQNTLSNQPESYQSFLGRHNAEIDTMLKVSSSYLTGGLKCRRLIVVKNGVMEGKNALTYFPESPYRPLDSDGSVGGYISWPYDNVKKSSFWDSNRSLDKGLIHEAGHGILQLPDEYPIETDFMAAGPINLASELAFKKLFQQNSREYSRLPDEQKQIIDILKKTLDSNGLPLRLKLDPNKVTEDNPGLFGIPDEWRIYLLSNRSDGRKSTIMGNINLNIGPFMTWLLTRRVTRNWSHNYTRRNTEAHWNYPAEFSSNNIIVLPPKYRGFDVQVWRTESTPLSKHLSKLVTSISSQDTKNGEANIRNPFSDAEFQNSFYPPTKAVFSQDALLYIKILDPKTGQVVAWRPIDVGDLSPIDHAIQGLPPPDVFRMEMNFAEGDQTQLSFNWGINYKNTFLPGVYNK